jgi:dephospho-CoA kinase
VKIYVTGVSGTGKSTLVRELTARGVNAIDLDEGFCHWRKREDGGRVLWEPGRDDAWYDAHGWICEIASLKDALEEQEDAVVVGLSSNQDQYWKLFDRVYVLTASAETIIHRLNTRVDNEYGKHPREQKRLLAWHKTFEKEMIEKGAFPLDGERPVEDVADDIVAALSC